MELKLTGIRKHFGEKEVLRGCGFTFQQGKIYGLLGRNGAGKTTLLRRTGTGSSRGTPTV